MGRSIFVLVGAAALVCAACSAPAVAPPPDPAVPTATTFDPASVPGCEDGCEVVVDVALTGGARLVGLQGSAPDTGFPRALLTRVAPGEEATPVEPVETAYVQDAACGGQICVVTFGAGAQSVVAVAVRVGPDGVEAGEQVIGGTGDAVLGDLDGDGSPDVALRQITGEGGPAAPRFWETRTTDGTTLTRTGCAEPTDPADEPAPTALLTDPCPTA